MKAVELPCAFILTVTRPHVAQEQSSKPGPKDLEWKDKDAGGRALAQGAAAGTAGTELPCQHVE